MIKHQIFFLTINLVFYRFTYVNLQSFIIYQRYSFKLLMNLSHIFISVNISTQMFAIQIKANLTLYLENIDFFAVSN